MPPKTKAPTALAAVAVKPTPWTQAGEMNVDQWIDGIINGHPDSRPAAFPPWRARWRGRSAFPPSSAFDLNAACSGWLYALEVGRSLIPRRLRQESAARGQYGRTAFPHHQSAGSRHGLPLWRRSRRRGSSAGALAAIVCIASASPEMPISMRPSSGWVAGRASPCPIPKRATISTTSTSRWMARPFSGRRSSAFPIRSECQTLTRHNLKPEDIAWVVAAPGQRTHPPLGQQEGRHPL